MQINPNSPLSPVPPSGKAAWASVKPQPQAEAVDFQATAALESALARTQEIRAEKVEKARVDVGRVDYPPRETIQRLSQLLALNWDRTNS